ncbi:TetR/AcrR family transcriptional regulator [Rhodovarius crocodyli]|uniref:TetR/AcrR family transcriptional regulator n=1 Tax=Rhodovarius crocodyli TaxID=1979269 RepID=A0A437MNP0_9PROT|nr:TetR/AcrR family transcriptional regulator [Rhodovarius crocodyli]RVT99256.1 TetR/AcrR family transcriptional regulator [Rhodovarius crocodyli]
MNANAKEAILAAAKRAAQARGYGGLNFRDLAAEVGIKSASIHYHFPTKADLGAAVARRYREDAMAALDALRAEAPDALAALRRYPETFRHALLAGNRMCLASFLAAEHDDLPEPVLREVLAFMEANVAWLARQLAEAGITAEEQAEPRARAVMAAIAGAQLMARSRADVGAYDALIAGYRQAGMLP